VLTSGMGGVVQFNTNILIYVLEEHSSIRNHGPSWYYRFHRT